MAAARRFVDLSVTIDENPHSEPWPPVIKRTEHRTAALGRAAAFNITPDDFPGGMHLAVEEVTLVTHVGTHMDAPWHYGPQSEGRPARTIPDIPLEWCYAPGVKLDFTRKRPGDSIEAAEVAAAVTAAGHEIKPLDIVLIHTGAARLLGQPGYTDAHPGLSREAVFWLLDRGVRVIGIDGYSLDKPFAVMAAEFRQHGLAAFFPSHYAGRDREYCQIEKLCNLELLPPSGFTVAAFPVKVAGAGGGWVRAVAILDD